METELKRILVVDDERAVRKMLSELLSNDGYQVVTAQDGYEGLELFQTNPIGLVLTDLNMPGMDGWSLASNIKAQSPGTPVVMVTGSGKEEVLERKKSSHVDGVIFKPFCIEEVIETLRELI